jgi:hypothetical protein
MAAGLVIFTGVGWLKSANAGQTTWSLAGRLHYTVLAITALLLMWTLQYWNFLA